MNKNTLSWLTATTLWLVNPVFSGCDSGTQSEFDFGEAELLDMIETINGQSWEMTFDGELSTVTVDFEQIIGETYIEGDQAALWSAIEIGSAQACGSRSFLAEAEACIDISSLPLEGTLTITSTIDLDSEPQVFDVSGSLDVFGKTLDNGELRVNSDDIQASWNATFDTEGELEGFAMGYID